MDIQVDPGILVVNLENCISSQATQQVVKGECMYTSTQSVMKGECLYTVAVATDEASTMVQIPVSVHCAGDVQQSFGTIAQLRPQLVTSADQQYSQVDPQQYTQIEMSEDLQCLVVESEEAPSSENSGDNRVIEVQTLPDLQQQESSDPNASYYAEIFNFLISKSAPIGATMSYKMMLKTRAKNYRIIDGVLYYWHNKPKKVITEKRDQVDILQKSHVESGTGVHLGVKKMYNAVNNVYFWRGQYVDVANFVRQCNICTEAGETRNTSLMLQKSLPENTDEEAVDDPLPEDESKVWQKVEVNLYGPYPRTVGHNEYLVTIVDPVSRWIVAHPVPDVNLPLNVASFVYKTFCSFGFAKCYIGKMLGQLFESIRSCYQQCINSMQEVLSTLGFPLDLPGTSSLFMLQDGEGEGQCAWAHHTLDTFVSNNPITWDSDLNKFLFEFHITVKEGVSSPYFKMFGRKPNRYLDEDKENMDALAKRNEVGITYRRRRLQSSILQCRHCEEAFTSKISFRIHQRKHTEEARRRGMLEGQEPTKPITEREKRLLNRAVLKRKQRLSKLQGSSEREGRLAPLAAQNCIGPDRERWGEERRAELQASTVAAVRGLLASTKESRRRRGKYKKFPTEIQEEMARYAIEQGTLKTVRTFSEKLGVVVSESTVRNIVKWYQCFTPEVKEEIGRFAAGFGIEAAACHFSERLGREVRHGLIRKFKKLYLLRYPDSKRQGNKNKGTQFDGNNVPTGVRQKNNKYTSELKEEIGQYACEHSVPSTVIHFSQRHNISLKENMVRRFRKMYLDKHRTTQDQQKQQEQQEQQHHHHHQQHQQLQEQDQQQHFLGPLLQQQQQHQELHQGHSSNLQEVIDPSSNQTIDILQTSLNLLNNPQLNSSATVVYNHPYQATVPQLQPSKHLISMNHQQNPPLTFQSVTQCNDNTIPTSMPMTYQHQQVPISASVIMNPNVATVQTFQPAQVYPTFNHQGRKRGKPSPAVDLKPKTAHIHSPVALNTSSVMSSTVLSLVEPCTSSQHLVINQDQSPPDESQDGTELIVDFSRHSTLDMACVADTSTTELNVIVHSTDSFNENLDSFQPSQNVAGSLELLDNIKSSCEPEGPFFCDVCNSRFQSKSSLISHLENHQGDLLRCSKCPYSSRSDKLLQYHQNIHKGTFQCKTCGKLFTRRIYLKYHVTNIHRGQRSSHVCEVCGAKFSYLSGLNMHIQLTHEPFKNYSCTLCNYVGKCTNSLASHMLRKHKKKFQCSVCEYSSLTEGGLNQHLRIVHSEGERQFACRQCSYRGAKRRQLLEHEKNMHCPDVCRHPCSICKKLFKTQVLMKHHLLTHTDQHLYSCKGCNYTTRFRQTLHYHIKRAHPGADMKDLSIGPSEADFQAIISSATQVDQQVIQNSDKCTLVIGQDGNDRDHGSSQDPSDITQANEILLASSYLDSTYASHHAESAHDFASEEPVPESHQDTISELQTETEQAVTIIDGSSLTSEDVHKIVNFTNDLSLRKHEMHQTLTPLNNINLEDSDTHQIVTFIEGLETEKGNIPQHVVTLLNSADVDSERTNGSQSTVTHINLLDGDITTHRNIIILPLRDAKVAIFQDDDVPMGQEQGQDHLALDDHSSLMDLIPQQNLAGHGVDNNSWNHVTVYHLDQ